jgi:hypothetical protein
MVQFYASRPLCNKCLAGTPASPIYSLEGRPIIANPSYEGAAAKTFRMEETAEPRFRGQVGSAHGAKAFAQRREREKRPHNVEDDRTRHDVEIYPMLRFRTGSR